MSEEFRTNRWNLKPWASPKSLETANFVSRMRQKMKICGGWRPPGGPRAGPYWIHTSRAGEARSRHTKAVVPGLVPGTQCPSRLKVQPLNGGAFRSEEHTSELQSLMRISYAVFCLTKKNTLR